MNGEAHRAAPQEMDRTDLRRLPDLPQGRDETQSIAQCILGALGDDHSQAFYYLVAAKVPERVVRTALSKIKHDGARSPARVFAHRMKQYAAERLTAPREHDLQSALAELSRDKTVGPRPE